MVEQDENKNRIRMWTVMIYFAADNKLTRYCLDDIAKLMTFTASSQIDAISQCDRIGTGNVRRYWFDSRYGLRDSTVEVLPETSTGDWEVLKEFIVWGMTNHPAKHYMLIIWGHGYGWQWHDNSCNAVGPLTTGGLAWDDTQSGALPIPDLRKALEEAAKVTGVAQIDILGMDACLMGMAEVAYEVQGLVRYLVGSEEAVPNKSWPYEQVFNWLVSRASPLLFVDELRDPTGLAVKLRDARDPLSRHLWDRFTDDEMKDDLRGYDGAAPPPKLLQRRLTSQLNELLRDPSLFDEQHFAEVRLAEKTPGLTAQNSPVKDLILFNRLLLEEAYPDEIKKNQDKDDVLPEELAVNIANLYIRRYQGERYVTMSICDLNRFDGLVEALQGLTEVIKRELADHNVRYAVMKSRAMVQSFYIKDYIDLFDFCSLLRKNCGHESIKSNCKNVMNAILGDERAERLSDESRKGGPPDGEGVKVEHGDISKVPVFDPVLHLPEERASGGGIVDYGYYGYPLRYSRGLSIYSPFESVEPKYRELEFSKITGWYEFLVEFLREPRAEQTF